MKSTWSKDWNKSVQPRKQRKYLANAPVHVRHKFLGARLSSVVSKQMGRRSLPVRKGDEVMIMRGSSKGMKGTVERVDLKKIKIFIEGIMAKKVDGSEVMKPIRPSNVMITKPNTSDKRRQKVLDRTSGNTKIKTEKSVKEETQKKITKEETQKKITKEDNTKIKEDNKKAATPAEKNEKVSEKTEVKKKSE